MCFQQNLRKMAVGTDAPGEASVKKKKKKKKHPPKKKKIPEYNTRDTLYPYGAGNQKKKGRETQRGWKTWAGCLQLSRHMIY